MNRTTTAVAALLAALAMAPAQARVVGSGLPFDGEMVDLTPRSTGGR